jgi:SAM-dependent methyltransferase
MPVYDESTYGERIAETYDDWYAEYDPAAITTLRELANGGRALELGIGTGRIALPLREAGVEVHGIDSSEAMIARLRAKPGGDQVPIAMGNFADVAVDRLYELIYIPFNTFFALLTQEDQLRCMHNVAMHLHPGGVFVVEAFVPDLKRYDEQQSVRAVDVSDDEVRLDVTRLNVATQQIVSQHVVMTTQGTRLFPVRLRYVWPAELDLMALLAGLRLKDRWGTWQRGPFWSASNKHISVYERPV